MDERAADEREDQWINWYNRFITPRFRYGAYAPHWHNHRDRGYLIVNDNEPDETVGLYSVYGYKINRYSASNPYCDDKKLPRPKDFDKIKAKVLNEVAIESYFNQKRFGRMENRILVIR